MAGKEMPSKVLGLEKPNRKTLLLSSTMKRESIRDVILEDGEKGQKATDMSST